MLLVSRTYDINQAALGGVRGVDIAMKQAFDRAEVERLVQTYSDLILRVSYTYLGSTQDAQDICQTVFVKLLTGKQKFRSAAHEKAWMIRTTINACKDLLHSAWHTRTCGLDACAEIPAPEAAEGSLLAAVNLLPGPYRTVIYLHYYEGYPTREIAQIVGATDDAVRQRLSRARARLREDLKGDYDDFPA